MQKSLTKRADKQLQTKNDGHMMLRSLKTRMQQLLPKFIGVERFMQVCMNEFRKNPKILDCTHDSIMGGLLLAAKEGLSIGDECFLIPRKNNKKGVMEVTYQRHYSGDLTLARRSNQFETISHGIVHENDEYEFIEGTENYLRTKRTFNERGEILFFWCSSTMKNGKPTFHIMSLWEMEQFRDEHAQRDYKTRKIVGPWATDFPAMGIKTIIKRHLKYQPKSYDGMGLQVQDGQVVELQGNDLIPHDEEENLVIDNDTGEVIQEQSSTPEPVKTKLATPNRAPRSTPKPAPKAAPRSEPTAAPKAASKAAPKPAPKPEPKKTEVKKGSNAWEETISTTQRSKVDMEINDINNITESLKLDQWRAKHGKRLMRQYNDAEFNKVMAYAENRYQNLIKKENEVKSELVSITPGIKEVECNGEMVDVADCERSSCRNDESCPLNSDQLTGSEPDDGGVF